MFAPDDAITREQLAVMLFRYAMYEKNYDTSGRADISQFSDCGQVSDWATDAISWANAAALIQGRADGTLDPHGWAKRCEAAAILHRFCNVYVQEKQG